MKVLPTTWEKVLIVDIEMSPFGWLVVFAFLIHINIQNAIDRIKDNVPQRSKKTPPNRPFLGAWRGLPERKEIGLFFGEFFQRLGDSKVDSAQSAFLRTILMP